MNRKELFNSPALRRFVTPLLVCLMIGLIIGLISYNPSHGNLWEVIFYWERAMILGMVAHDSAWWAGVLFFKWPVGKGLRQNWKKCLLGGINTYLLFLWLFWEYLSFSQMPLLLGQVMGVSLITQVFLLQTNYYDHLASIQKFSKESKSSLPQKLIKLPQEAHPGDVRTPVITRKPAQQVEPDFLIRKENGIKEKIQVTNISCIHIKDHYCLVTYKREEQWQQWLVHEQLKNLELKFSDNLVRINRSTLVNPHMIRRIDGKKGKYLVTLQGTAEATFAITRSRQHLVEELMPLIS